MSFYTSADSSPFPFKLPSSPELLSFGNSKLLSFQITFLQTLYLQLLKMSRLTLSELQTRQVTLFPQMLLSWKGWKEILESLQLDFSSFNGVRAEMSWQACIWSMYNTSRVQGSPAQECSWCSPPSTLHLDNKIKDRRNTSRILLSSYVCP